MRIANFLLGLAWAISVIPSAAANDLTKIDRTIRKEPTYRSQAPKYCLLVFGPKAETRVWLVLDLDQKPWEPDQGKKNFLYVDRNGNGDLTEPDERLVCRIRVGHHDSSIGSWTTENPSFQIGDIVERDGKTRHTDLTVDVDSYVQDYRPCSLSLKVQGRHTQWAGGMLLRFGDRPSEASIIHFNGPLALRVRMEGGGWHIPSAPDEKSKRRFSDEHPPQQNVLSLVRGQESELRAQIGTPGLGRGTFAAISTEAVPENVHPVADLEFPSIDPSKPPIPMRVILRQRCCGSRFYDTVRVPEAARPGKAKVVLSLPDWREVKVAPATGEVSVVNPSPPRASEKK